MCVLEFSNIIHLMRFVLEIFIILSRLPKMRIWKDTPVHPPLTLYPTLESEAEWRGYGLVLVVDVFQ